MTTDLTDIGKARFERLKDVATLYRMYIRNPDYYDDELGHLFEYGLDLSWDSEDGCIVWLLSTGGPHEEIRFFGGTQFKFAHFVYKDWDTYNESLIAYDWGFHDELSGLYDLFNEIVDRG